MLPGFFYFEECIGSQFKGTKLDGFFSATEKTQEGLTFPPTIIRAVYSSHAN